MKYLLDKPDYGRPVEVYRNLHRDCYSIRCAKTKRVIYHAKSVYLQDVTFKVNVSGRERVLREKKKNVHATVRGIWLPTIPLDYSNIDKFMLGMVNREDRVYYDPYRYDSFMWKRLRIYEADRAILDRDFKMYAGFKK